MKVIAVIALTAAGLARWILLATSTVVGNSWKSTDSGHTWVQVTSLSSATMTPDQVSKLGFKATAASMSPATGETNIVVTARNKAVWAPANSVPSYTTDNGATWTATDLPALAGVGINRAYRLVADRKNPNKVYAYDSGGAWWNQWSDTAWRA